MHASSITHYGLTRDEFASKVGKHRSCFDNRLRAICGSGDYHASVTLDKSAVTCAACAAKLTGDPNPWPDMADSLADDANF